MSILFVPEPFQKTQSATLQRSADESAAAIIVVAHDDKILGQLDKIVRLGDARLEGVSAKLFIKTGSPESSDLK